jgi:hypothetical protein
MSRQFFHDLLNKKKTKHKKDDDLLNNLYKVPKKDKKENSPTFQVFKPNLIHQADLLFLPDDNGYKYALVVVDDHSRICDAVPLKSKTAKEIINAFKNIYEKHKILKKPELIEVDAGSEFKGQVAKWLKENLKVDIRVAKAARHRQQAVVERKNQSIGTALAKRQAAEELLTDEHSTKWVDDLKIFIDELNKKTKKDYKPLKKEKSIKPRATGNAKNLLPIGAQVRVMLDAPRDYVSGKRLHGKFRSGDIRFDPEVKTITNIILNPDQPPMYQINNKPSPAYTKNQLQLVPKNEKYPSKDLIRNEKERTQFKVEKLLEKVKRNGRWYFKVKWLGYDDSENTYEPRSTLIKDIPDMVRQFEKR